MIANQSSYDPRVTLPNLAIDDDYSVSSYTRVDHATDNKWWQLNMKFVRKIKGACVKAGNVNRFYIFFSKAPLVHSRISDLLSDPWVDYVYVNGYNPNSNCYTYSGLCQYVMIVTEQGQHMDLFEVDILGDPNDGPNDPHVGPPYIIGPTYNPPYGTCGPWYWPTNDPEFIPNIFGPPFESPYGPNDPDPDDPWSNWENCNDGIDNDWNGLIDCADYPCGVGWTHVKKEDPSCEICDDGTLCFWTGKMVKKVSIDGGLTWTTLPDSRKFCFENLAEGTYYFEFESFAGCRTNASITLSAPPPGPSTGDCANGDFEQGNFQGWTGGTTNDYDLPFPNSILDIGNTHTILSNFTDPIVPIINVRNGSFVCRLGNNEAPPSQSERLTYCFTVDQDNADFGFEYAVVLEIPVEHPTDGQPFFQYRVFQQSNQTNISGPVRTSTSDPLLETYGDVKSLGWQCVKVDLFPFIGTNVCAEFITSDCNREEHFGYAYIDALCADNFDPTAEIIVNDIYCVDQKVPVNIIGNGFNSFNFVISKIVSDGETDIFESEIEDGFQASIDDALAFYEDNTNFTMECGNQYKIQFNGFNNDCGQVSISKIFKYVCPEYEFDYCDPMYYCTSSNILPIKGVNACNNCTYEWSSDGVGGPLGLIGKTEKFPYLDKGVAFNAFDKTYKVKITTPEGCKYDDQFRAQSIMLDLEAEIIHLTHCDYDIFGSLTLNYSIPNQDLYVKAINLIDNSEIIGTLTGAGLTKTFIFNIERQTDTRYKIVVGINSNYFCLGGNCNQEITLDKVTSPFAPQWKAIWPNAICHNVNFWGYQCQDENTIFNLTFNNSVNNSCDVSSPQKSSIYYLKLNIYDRSGSLMYTDEISKSASDANGILGNEIGWNGLINDDEPEGGTYTFKAWIKSCYIGDEPCHECCNHVELEYPSHCNDLIKNDGYWGHCAKGIYENENGCDGCEIIVGTFDLLN